MLQYFEAARVDEIEVGAARTFEIAGRKIAVARTGERVFAIDALCSHMGVPLEQGSIDGEEIVCPWHSARFCMKTGVKTAGRPNWQAIKSYPARIVEGVIEIGIETGLAAERVATQACAGPPSRAIA